jgi:capsular exopolysaccharide synthesis family protein
MPPAGRPESEGRRVDLRDYLRILRKNWLLVLLCVVLAVGAAAAAAYTATPKYRASTQLFVAARDTGGDVSGLNAGGQFTQQRVQYYADIVDSPEVAKAVASQIGGISAKKIAKEVTASAPLNTVLVNVHVTDTSPQRAQAIANTLSDEFATYVADLETTPGAATSPVKVTVVKRAALPTAPVSPRKKLDVGLGLLVGLAVGVGGAILRETLDTSVRDPEQVQRDLGLPMLGAIATDPDARKRPLIVHADPHSPRAEAFRSLRTNLQFVDVDHAPRSIVVTSSVPEEGKSTSAANLAISLAQTGLRVLLVEADLRRPRLAEYLGIEGAVGLTSVLIGQASATEAIQPWGTDGKLHVLASGPTPPNPSELLGSQGMAHLMHELESDYDLVLFDAPPLLPVTDAAVVASIASGAIMIVRHGSTKREQLARAVDSLRSVGATIYGVVMTMTPSRGPDAYHYGYGYGYDRHSTHQRGHAELTTPVPASPVASASSNGSVHSGALAPPSPYRTEPAPAERSSEPL